MVENLRKFKWDQSSRDSFEEVAPEVEEVLVKKGDPFVEVSIRAVLPDSCFHLHDVFISTEGNRTRITPRYRWKAPDGNTRCRRSRRDFIEKIADLDPHAESTRALEVLGFDGWHEAQYKP